MSATGNNQLPAEILPGIFPRDYQLEAVEVLRSLRARGAERGLVTMATGLGKTAVGVLDVHNFLEEQNDPDTKFLFLTHNNDIIDQSWARFSTALAATELKFGYLQPGRTLDELLSATFLFASFQMMHRGRFEGEPIRDIFARDHFAHVLVDEAHHASAPTYRPTLQHFTPIFKLGLTATPDRQDRKDIRYIFGREVFRKSLPEGIAEGFLARPHYVGIAPTATVKIVREGLEQQEQVRRLDRATVEEIAKDIQERVAHIDQPKILVYTGSIAEADLYADLLPGAIALHSGIPRAERQDTLEDFRATRPAILTSVDIINEGVDIPDVDVIVMARSTASETIFLQQLGRGLRKTPTKEEVLILDYVANSDRLHMVARLMNDFPRDPDEEEGRGRQPRRQRKLEDIITEPEIDLQNALFEFDPTVLDIIKILSEREERNRMFSAQTAEKSVTDYIELCEKFGTKWIPHNRLQKELGRDGVELLLSPFSGRLTDLRVKAFGIPELVDYPDMVTVSSLVQETGIYYTKLLYAMQRLGIPETLLMASNGVESRVIDRRHIRDIVRYQSVAGKSLMYWPSQPQIEDDETLATDVIADAEPGMSRRAFALALKEAGLIRHTQFIFTNTQRAVVTSMQRDQVERMGEYLQSLAIADQHNSTSIEDIATTTEQTILHVYKAMDEHGIKGKCLRSPVDNVVRIYLNQSQTSRVVRTLDRLGGKAQN